jgi:uncharacterized membrane protein YjdF
LSDEERKPSTTDYMAAAALAYGIVYFWIKLKMVAGTPSLLTYPIYYLAGLVPSYLVCRRIDSAHLAVGIRVALVAWVFTAVMLLAFVEEPSLAFFGILLICLVLGGATASYLALRQSLQPRSREVDSEKSPTP